MVQLNSRVSQLLQNLLVGSIGSLIAILISFGKLSGEIDRTTNSVEKNQDRLHKVEINQERYSKDIEYIKERLTEQGAFIRQMSNEYQFDPVSGRMIRRGGRNNSDGLYDRNRSKRED